VLQFIIDGGSPFQSTCYCLTVHNLLISHSILELVDAAVDPSLLQPIKDTILKVDGVKVVTP
jgi:divalent metal cation (Fe/Co/Zn/Cd) transporter